MDETIKDLLPYIFYIFGSIFFLIGSILSIMMKLNRN